MTLVEQAAGIAEQVLFPAALAVDRAGRIPPGHLDLLAAHRLYGLIAPAEAGGAGADHPTACKIVEILAAGCLATTLVWIQHQGALRRVLAAPMPVRERYLGALCRGERRAGVALGGCLPGPPILSARAVSGGYLLAGHSPWVTGWGMIDTLCVAARDERGELLWSLVDAAESDTLSARPQQMMVAGASGTVTARFSGRFVPADQVLGTQPLAEFARQDARGLQLNGHLALGVVERCRALLGPGRLDEQAAACRAALHRGTAESLPAARAAASELAVRAATLLLVHTGSRAILADQHAQRLAREAMFLCVFASRAAIKAELAARLAAPRDRSPAP